MKDAVTNVVIVKRRFGKNQAFKTNMKIKKRGLKKRNETRKNHTTKMVLEETECKEI
jgi:hypothetical protein